MRKLIPFLLGQFILFSLILFSFQEKEETQPAKNYNSSPEYVKNNKNEQKEKINPDSLNIASDSASFASDSSLFHPKMPDSVQTTQSAKEPSFGQFYRYIKSHTKSPIVFILFI